MRTAISMGGYAFEAGDLIERRHELTPDAALRASTRLDLRGEPVEAATALSRLLDPAPFEQALRSSR
jgi:hypothetical protein